ncbi:T9SS type A sorting domain-containing protein [uncultured Dokdonia sp.]|uniref:T9SS type A sorting domain-containing protein n=1 Tax=uncultured Dokdonia sp. TaxID=575653 RepID=UPI002627209B|nr:T9SS type A sorting domain-containing protein [uncultured Dokdonia sp.]
MKSKLLITVCLIINLYGYAQNVNIPDANFKSLLVANSNINTNGDGEIQVAEAMSYTGGISVPNQNIQDLTGIEAFTEIVALQAFFNPISSIDISQNTQLTQLLIEQTNISGELDLSMLTQLTDFKGHTTNLTAVNMANGNNVNMTRFEVQDTPVTCVQIDSGFTPSANWLIDASASYSETCPEFTCIVDIPDPIFKSVLLGSAIVNTNGNNEIECSEAASFTGELFLTVLNIQDLTGIEAFTSLTSLNCSETLLTSLNVSANIALTELNIANTQITILDLSSNNLLNEFIGVNTSLTSLDVSANSMLSRIVVSNNAQLEDLNVANGNNTAITDSDFFANNNPNLSCITVDDVAYSDANWTNIDTQTSFSLNCSSNTDTTPPVAVCQDITIQLDANGNATILTSDIDNGSTDDVGIGAFSVTPSGFDCDDIGANTVTLTVVDTAGNTDTCTATVTVVDTINPTIVSVADITENVDTGMCSAMVSFPVIIVNDNCSSTSFTTDAPAGQIFPVGTTVVTVTGMDDSGNIATDTFNVTVVDNEAPILDCVVLETIEVNEGETFTLPDYVADGDTTATDNCSVTITQDPAAGTVLVADTYQLTFTATDASGNTETCTQNLIIEEVLSVQDVSIESAISLYPNPATDVIQITSEIALTNVEVYNINGQLVLTSNPVAEINISKLSSGVYFVTLYSETSFITKKLIKK